MARLSQHNAGDKSCKTYKHRPWRVVAIVTGFRTKAAALAFEFGWQYPRTPLYLLRAAMNKRKLRTLNKYGVLNNVGVAMRDVRTRMKNSPRKASHNSTEWALLTLGNMLSVLYWNEMGLKVTVVVSLCVCVCVACGVWRVACGVSCGEWRVWVACGVWGWPARMWHHA